MRNGWTSSTPYTRCFPHYCTILYYPDRPAARGKTRGFRQYSTASSRGRKGFLFQVLARWQAFRSCTGWPDIDRFVWLTVRSFVHTVAPIGVFAGVSGIDRDQDQTTFLETRHMPALPEPKKGGRPSGTFQSPATTERVRIGSRTRCR